MATTDVAQEVVDAAKRVASIFASGCDRCDGDDLALLEQAGLMSCEICRDNFGQDTLEVGEPMWSFNTNGEALLRKISMTTPVPVPRSREG